MTDRTGSGQNTFRAKQIYGSKPLYMLYFSMLAAYLIDLMINGLRYEIEQRISFVYKGDIHERLQKNISGMVGRSLF